MPKLPETLIMMCFRRFICLETALEVKETSQRIQMKNCIFYGRVVRYKSAKGCKIMPKLPNTLVVLPYDPNWKTEFERIRDYLMKQIGDLVIEIKHVGSTSVPGLSAKPIIDIVAVMESYDVFPTIVSRLEKVGFQHEGDGGIKEREVFK